MISYLFCRFYHSAFWILFSIKKSLYFVVTVQPLSKACRVFKFVAAGCVIVMAIVNGTMIPLARMERRCPQSGRGRGQEIVSCGGYIQRTPIGVLTHGLNCYILLLPIYLNSRDCNNSCVLRLSACGRYACAKPLLLRNTRLFNRNNSCAPAIGLRPIRLRKAAIAAQYAAVLLYQFAYAPAISMRAVLP